MTGWDVLLAMLFVLGCPAPRWVVKAFPSLPERCQRVYHAADLIDADELGQWVEAMKRGEFYYQTLRGGHVLELMPAMFAQRVNTPWLWTENLFPESAWLEYQIQFAYETHCRYNRSGMFPGVDYDWDRRAAINRGCLARMKIYQDVVISRTSDSRGDRRKALKRVYSAIGPDDYYRGQLPPIVPVELFREKP